MMRCALCGRGLDAPTVLIGNLPVGPVCARRAGLLEKARKTPGGWVSLPDGQRTLASMAERDPLTPDLFDHVPQ